MISLRLIFITEDLKVMWTQSQISYLAGIIDGEGTFYIGYSCKKWGSRMYVVNTDKRLIDWLKNTFGGLVYTRNSLKNPAWKTKYEWILEKAKIPPICEVILPYLICKKEQAELMIKFRKTFEVKRDTSPETIEFRSKCHSHMNYLNLRGPPQTLASGCHVP